MSTSCILVLDHGTTGLKCCLVNRAGEIFAHSYAKITQFYPQAGWVEHDPAELWRLTQDAMTDVLQQAGLSWSAVEAIGITNQRETSILWDKATGEPIHPAIVWQCRRTAEWCGELKQDEGGRQAILEKTGLVIDAYFSASKIRWLLHNVPGAKALAAQNNLLFGTVDTWILWHLSGKTCHATDFTNASRTMLLDIRSRQWDPELLSLFEVPEQILPKVQCTAGLFAETDPSVTGGHKIPVMSMIGDQQSALYGQKCWTPGSAKNTFGTGAFLMMNLGDEYLLSNDGLLTTLACDAQGNPAYALEGAIFIAGAAMEWLKNLGCFESFGEADVLAQSLEDNAGVYLVPAFVGLGAPYWRGDVRGVLSGLTQGTGKAHLSRAGLESMAYQVDEMLRLMSQTAHLQMDGLKVDGGVSRSAFLMQFLSDITAMPVHRMTDADLTAKGAAYLAGLASGFWQSPDEILQLPEPKDTFTPAMDEVCRARLTQGWQDAVKKALL